jgi:hypothetical protein
VTRTLVRARAFLIVAAGLALTSVSVACSSTPRTLPLPVAGFPDRCRGVGVEATLGGDPSDPRVTWLVSADGSQTPLVWPSGWTGRFTPSLEVLDAKGTVRYRQGDAVSAACLAGPAEHPASLLMIEGLTQTQGDSGLP